MKYIAWYSENTIYEDIFHSHLEPTLKQFNLDYEAIPMPNYKRWNHNVALKPLVIKNALEKYKEPLVLLDVDCKINENPLLFETINPDEFDIACHFLEWESWYNRPGETRRELLTGTMWFNYTEEVLALCHEWYKITWASKCADQPVIEGLLKASFNSIRVYELPLCYCYINSLPREQPVFVKLQNPVITHFQASRTTKRGIL